MSLDAWLSIVAPGFAAAAAASYLGYRRERAKAVWLSKRVLEEGTPGPPSGTSLLEELFDLPEPVQRYFQNVLNQWQGYVGKAAMRQSGTLRLGGRAGKWRAFDARHLVAPWRRSFFWNARIAIPLGHVRVHDSYIDGTGTGRVSLMSALPLTCETGLSELNSGALHRFLAEAVWYPTALLPVSGVRWRALDGSSAVASLTDHGTTVSLEFRFNQAGEVMSIYTPGRFRRGEGGYRKAPWEGHFRNYQMCSGMRIPRYAEVGWYVGDALELVWQGNITALDYEFIR